MDIDIGTPLENPGSVCTVKDFKLSDDSVHVSFGAANPRGWGNSIAAANITIEAVDVHLTVYGDEVQRFLECSTPSEALHQAYLVLITHLNATQLRETMEGMIARSYEKGKRDGIEEWQGKLRELAGLRR